MKIFDTSQIPDLDALPSYERELIYCGLDTMITNEVRDNLLLETDPLSSATYNTSRLFLGPAFDLMKRGFLIDTKARDEVVAELSQRKETLNSYLQKLAFPVWKKPLNYNSPLQMKSFFYDHLFIPTQYETKKGERKISTGRGPLEKIERNYPLGTIFARIVMRLRDHDKVLSTMTQGLLDGRWHASFNVAGTDSFRWSSSAHPLKVGCLPGRAEVLTKSGWVSLDRLSSNQEVMQWDAGKLTFAKATPVKTTAPSKYLEISSSQTYQLLTPEHRIPYYHAGHKHTKLHVSTAEQFHKLGSTKLPVSGMFSGGTFHAPLLIKFIVAALADAGYENGTYRFAFKKQRKVDRLELLLNQLQLPYTKTVNPSNPDYTRFYVKSPLYFSDKYGDWLYNLSPETAHSLYEELGFWDGHRRNKSSLFYTADEEQAKVVASAAHLYGYSATWHTHNNFGGYNKNPNATLTTVNIKPRTHIYCAPEHKRWVPTNTKYVYCVSVPSSYFLCRLDGRVFVTGNSNLQNIDDEIRRIFVADPGYILFSCDQQGAEARAVAYTTGDAAYIKAVESGDVHTTVASMVWGFEPKRELSDRTFYRDLSYRDISKKFTHGSSYGGKPRTLAIQARTPIALVEEFQSNFFKNFPGIQKWHSWTDKQLQSKGYLITAYGDRRQFWGKLNDDSTLRSAIAFQPQHIVGKLTAVALYRIWSELPHDKVQILNNGHDAVIGQIKKEYFDVLMPSVLQCLDNPLDVVDIHGKSRRMSIPWEASYGANWGKMKFDKKTSTVINPKGLRDYKGKLDADALHW